MKKIIRSQLYQLFLDKAIIVILIPWLISLAAAIIQRESDVSISVPEDLPPGSLVFVKIWLENHSDTTIFAFIISALLLAKDFGDIYIVCGPILFHQKHKTIGKNKVVVPEAFFKVVLCRKGTPKAIGFIYPNDGKKRSMSDCVRTVDEVERITRIDFFPALSDDIENRVEAKANLKAW